MYIFCISLTKVFYHFGELMKNALIYIHHLVRRFIFNQEHWLSIDGLVQDCSISSANALEILQSCTEPSISGCPVRQICNTSFILPCFLFPPEKSCRKLSGKHRKPTWLLAKTVDELSMLIGLRFIRMSADQRQAPALQELGRDQLLMIAPHQIRY